MTDEKIISQLESLVEEAETHIEPDCEQVWLDDREALLEAIKAKKMLEFYKKALGFACNHIFWMCEEKTCNTCRFANKCLNDNTNSWEDTFLQEAGMPIK